MNKLTQYLQARDWWPLVVVGVAIGCAAAAIVISATEYSERETEPVRTYGLKMQEVRIDSCEYIIGRGQYKTGVYAITHKANCDNHGVKP